MSFKKYINRQFSKAAEHYNKMAALQFETTHSLLNFLPLCNPKQILDLGTGTGCALKPLQIKYPEAQVYALDLSEKMLLQAKTIQNKIINADFDAMPFVSQSFDLVFSNLALQWSIDLTKSLTEVSKILRSGGQLVFSTLTEGSLRELQRRQFLKSIQIIEALQQAGFELENTLHESKKFYFKDFKTLLLSLKQIGANASNEKEFKGLAARQMLKKLEQNHPRAECLEYPLTYELMYISARKI